MAKSPPYKPPRGTKGKSLAGIKACGCITAALAVRMPDNYSQTTEKDVREFYADMASTGRTIEWRDDDEIRAKLFRKCKEQHG